jgi:exodeoxyribonuclease VII large subunit
VSTARQPNLFVQQAPIRQAPIRLTVTGLHREMKRALNGLGAVEVTGEAHDVKVRGATTYFMLKERASQVAVTVPSTKQRWCAVQSGQSVLVTGRLDTAQSTGRLSLVAEAIVPTGDGAIAARINEVRDRLRADGLLDRPRRRLPLLPQKVVVVCGNDAAVMHDFRRVTEDRFPGFGIEYVTTSQSSAESLVDGFYRALATVGVDVVVLARGGGDATMLLPYSDETLCRAIAASPVAVVTAIGHEIDSPLCDEVSDVRAATPSVAAARVVPDRSAIQVRLDTDLRRCCAALLHRSSSHRTVLGHRKDQLAVAPDMRLRVARHRLDSVRISDALTRSVSQWRAVLDGMQPSAALAVRIDLSRANLDGLAARARPPQLDPFRDQLAALRLRADSFSPQQVLDRGFAIVRRVDGSVVRSSDDLVDGDRLSITVADGTVQVVVVRPLPTEPPVSLPDDQGDKTTNALF